MSSDPQQLTVFQDKLYFAATDLTGNKLWRSDGSDSGTVQIPSLGGQSDYYWPGGFKILGDWLIFHAKGVGIGDELYKSDGNHVFLIKDILQSPCSLECGSQPRSFTIINNMVVFAANSNESYPYDRDLWRTDGTEAGTLRLSDICPGSCDADPYYLFREGNHVFYKANDGLHGDELWAYQPQLKEIYIPQIFR